jgi:hypothetical protein
MKINLERLFGKEAAHRLRNLGLHKVAAAKLRTDGHAIPDELDIRSAIQALGTNVYQKNAEYQSIVEGIVAFDDLTKKGSWKEDMMAASQEATDSAMSEMQERQGAGEELDPREYLTGKGFRYLGGQQWMTPVPEQYQEQHGAWQKENPGQLYFDSME